MLRPEPLENSLMAENLLHNLFIKGQRFFKLKELSTCFLSYVYKLYSLVGAFVSLTVLFIFLYSFLKT